jgi:hypothetical protein
MREISFFAILNRHKCRGMSQTDYHPLQVPIAALQAQRAP